MTPTNPDALADALARELARLDGWQDPDALWTDNLGIIARGGEGSPVYLDYVEDAGKLIAGPLAPLLADLQRVTAERDEALIVAHTMREGVRDAADEATYHRNNCLIAQREKAAAEARAAQLQAEVEAEVEAKDRALTEIAEMTEMGLAPYSTDLGTQAFEWRMRPTRAAGIARTALAARAATAREG